MYFSHIGMRGKIWEDVLETTHIVVIIRLLGGVLVDFYQFGTTLDISGKRKSPLRDYLHQTVGHFEIDDWREWYHAWAGGPGSYKKVD